MTAPFTFSYGFTTYYIPERMMPALRHWIDHGIPPGDFLLAVLCNDLMDAIGRADDENRQNLPAYISFLFNEAPSPCWGSPPKVIAWAARFGVTL